MDKDKVKKEISYDKDKGDRIFEAISHLRTKGMIKLQKDLMKHFKCGESSITRAISGDDRYTDGFIKKLIKAFPFINYDYLMSGVGALEIQPKYNDVQTDNVDTINEDILIYQGKNKIIEFFESEIKVYREREKEFNRRLNDAESENKRKDEIINNLNKDNSILGKENASLKTQVEMLKSKSRKQSGGSVPEKIAGAG